MRRSGFSVIEVIIALGMAAVVISAVGNLTAATHRLTSSSGKEIQATAYAKQWLELISAQANQQFGCNCTAGTCSGGSPNTCTIGGQQCQADARPGFSSCWVAAPMDLSPFTFTGSGPWTATDPAAPAGFTRTMTISTYTGDPNEKQVTVNVAWTGGHVQLSTLLTAWKNF